MSQFHPRTLLIPVDFSETSLAGLEAAKALGRKWGSRLLLVHVNDSSPALLFENIHTRSDQEELAVYSRNLRERLSSLTRDYPDAMTDVFGGDAREAIGRLSEKQSADLVVMGTHGYQGWRHWVLGSVAESIASVSALPLLTVHSRPGPGWPTRILVPMKFTDYADRALDYALDFAQSLEADLTLLHVVEESSSVRTEEALDRHLERLLGPERFRGMRRLLAYGDPAERIVEEARAGLFDLVVLSAHRRFAWKRWGSKMTAARVLRRSEVPVLTVPVQEHAFARAEDSLLSRVQARPKLL